MQAATLEAKWQGSRISLKSSFLGVGGHHTKQELGLCIPNIQIPLLNEWMHHVLNFASDRPAGPKGDRLWAVTFVFLSISQPNLHSWWSTCHQRPGGYNDKTHPSTCSGLHELSWDLSQGALSQGNSVWKYLSIYQRYLTSDKAIPLLGIYPRDNSVRYMDVTDHCSINWKSKRLETRLS